MSHTSDDAVVISARWLAKALAIDHTTAERLADQLQDDATLLDIIAEQADTLLAEEA